MLIYSVTFGDYGWGKLELIHRDDHTYLQTISVDPINRLQGHGTFLIRLAEMETRQHENDYMTAYIWTEGALRLLYDCFGERLEMYESLKNEDSPRLSFEDGLELLERTGNVCVLCRVEELECRF